MPENTDTATTEHLVWDDFARRHLRAWYESGLAPYDWDEDDLDEFMNYVEEHNTEFSLYASWTSIAAAFERERKS